MILKIKIKNSLGFLIVFLFSSNVIAQDSSYSDFDLHGGVTVKAPIQWKKTDHFQLYSTPMKIYDVIVTDKKKYSFVSLVVFLPEYRGNLDLTKYLLSLDIQQEREGLKRKVQILDSNLVFKNNIQVAFYKYSFLNLQHKKCLGIKVLFRDLHRNYYEMEIISYLIEMKDFQKTAETIFDSITFNERSKKE